MIQIFPPESLKAMSSSENEKRYKKFWENYFKKSLRIFIGIFLEEWNAIIAVLYLESNVKIINLYY